jgi:hypothetical protein
MLFCVVAALMATGIWLSIFALCRVGCAVLRQRSSSNGLRKQATAPDAEARSLTLMSPYTVMTRTDLLSSAKTAAATPDRSVAVQPHIENGTVGVIRPHV